MALIPTKGRYNIALNGQGYILNGQPNNPAYVAAQAPIYSNRFSQGDHDYNDFSFWWFQAQTDWSAGIKDSISYADDAKYYYASNVDTYSQPGTVKLGLAPVLDHTFAENILCMAELYRDQEYIRLYGTDINSSTAIPALYLYDTTANTYTNVSNSGAGIFTTSQHGVSFITPHYDSAFIGTLGNGSTTNSRAFVVQGGSGSGPVQNITAYVASVMAYTPRNGRAGVYMNGTMYLFAGGSGDGDSRISIVKTTKDFPSANADFTLVGSFDNGSFVIAAVGFAGNLYYLAVQGSTMDFRQYNLASNADVSIQKFYGVNLAAGVIQGVVGGLQNLLQVLSGQIIITIPSKEIWTYNGGSLTRIYRKDDYKRVTVSDKVATGFLDKGCIISEGKAWWGNLMYDGTNFHNTVKPYGDVDAGVNLPMMGSATSKRFYVDSADGLSVYVSDPNGTVYKPGTGSNAFVVLNQTDNVPSIDKLLSNINIGFNKLITGQSLEVYYLLDGDPVPDITQWTLLGTASYTNDGGVVNFKSLLFPVGVTARRVWIRVNLLGPGTSTPVLNDLTLQYLPVVNYAKTWTIRLNAADQIYLLDGQLEKRTGRQIAGLLEQTWLTKSTIDFQDVNYASCLLTSALSASATSMAVDNTADFPEQGRLKIDNEEMFYTGKTLKSFTGLSRGKHGTAAVSHASATAVSVGLYKAIITDYQFTVPLLEKDKMVESVVQLSVREAGYV